MRFICLGYFDERSWERLSKSEQDSLMERCLAYDDELRQGGHFVDGLPLGSSSKAVTLRGVEGTAAKTDGPFTETKEVLGGILVLEAKDLEQAVGLMSKHPGVLMGGFEIREEDEAARRYMEERAAESKLVS